LLATVLGVVGLTAAVAAAAPSSAVPVLGHRSLASRVVPLGCGNPANHTSRRLLPALRVPMAGHDTCFGKVYDGTGAAAANSSAPSGFGPAQIRSAYGLNGTSSGHQTVAVVDAYDDPNVEADLAHYRSHYHLPACTKANGCLRKVNHDGKSTPLPARDAGWGQETTLDLDAVSAACPDCRLLLVEASSAIPSALDAAVDRAVAMGARFVSNSYGGPEDSSILREDKHFNRRSVAMVAAAGDDGYGVNYPASSRYVTAVGGTRLYKLTTHRGWGETAWGGTGSGCSRFEPKPSWQHDGSCKRRTVNDTAAVADPETGIATYDTFNTCGNVSSQACDTLLNSGAEQGQNGWSRVGGTSLSAPIVAGIYALGRHGVHYASRLYSHTKWLNDVTHGSNGSCGGRYLCHAKTRYDGPSGLGTPWGRDAF
jgi:subtilase family serine protease